MADTMSCPACEGSGMVGASSCPRCRGTGSVRAPDTAAVMVPPAGDDEVSPEARALVERELAEALDAPRLKLKGRHVKLSAGARRGRGLGFKR